MTAAADIAGEIARVRARWGDQLGRVSDAWAVTVLAEEVGEVARCVHDARFGPSSLRNDPELRDELVQVAAVASMWIERIDAREART